MERRKRIRPVRSAAQPPARQTREVCCAASPFCRPQRFLGLLLFLLLASCQYSKKATQNLFDKAKQNSPYDIIVVPGIFFENGQWDRVMKGRIYWAKYLYDQGLTRNIMFSGGAVHTAYYEAQVMAMYAEAIGIPKEHIYLELKAEHSTENIYYGYKMALRDGFKKVALASDPFQTKMLRRYARKKVNAEIGLIPMVVDTMKILEPQMQDPQIDYKQAFKENFVPLKERESFFKRLRGTIRGNVDTSAYR